MPVQIQIRHDTAANWTSADPTLALGEMGVETDTDFFKFGDGSTSWTGLSYAGGSSSLSVSDGGTPVNPTTSIVFTGATVTDAGGGEADVSITGAGASPLTTKGDIWGFSTVDARVPVGTDSYVLTADSGASLGVSWQVGGGGGGSSRYPLDSYTLDGTYGDDFTGSGLSGIWTRRNFTGGAETYQVGYDPTFIRISTASRSTGDGYFQSGAIPDGTYAMKFIPRWWASLKVAWGLAILDSSGNGCATVFYDSSRALYCTDISTYSAYNSGNQVGSGDLWPAGGALIGAENPVWVYLRKSSDDYFAAYSFDGNNWSPESSAKNKSFTPAFLGMFLSPLGDTGSFLVDVDWFNKIA